MKLKGCHISEAEGRVLSYIVQKNQSIQTVDLTSSVAQDPASLLLFLQQIGKESRIKVLVLENIRTSFSDCIVGFGTALGENVTLECLSMR